MEHDRRGIPLQRNRLPLDINVANVKEEKKKKREIEGKKLISRHLDPVLESPRDHLW